MSLATSVLDQQDLELFRQKVPIGFEKVEAALQSASPIALQGRPTAMPKLDGPSVVWTVDKVSYILQRLCIHVKNVPYLKRVIVHTVDAKDLASIFLNRSYRFLIEHPAVKFVVMDVDHIPNLQESLRIFSPDPWDLSNETEFPFTFDSLYPGQDDLIQRTRETYSAVQFLYRGGLGDESYLNDTMEGFRNTFLNLKNILRQPDLEGVRGKFRNKPAVLLGAGPSVQSQLEFFKHNQDRFVLIAADTMLKPLSEMGIHPHFIVSIEREDAIIDLLNDPKDHPNSLLVASSVLKPASLAVYRGPTSPYLATFTRSSFFPFTRTRLNTGHSCMGLAMATASLLECNPIYLAGIDLCWSAGGKSHMDRVSYLDKDFYLEQNAQLMAQSYPTKNHRGETVRTNRYWTMFKHQFEEWTQNQKGKVFNLSPDGLPLMGAPFVELKEVELLSAPISFATEIQKLLPYDRIKTSRAEMEQFIRSAKLLVNELEALFKSRTSLSPEDQFSRLEKLQSYNLVIRPLLDSEIRPVTLRTQSQLSDRFWTALEEVRKSFQQAQQDLSSLLDEQLQQKFMLY